MDFDRIRYDGCGPGSVVGIVTGYGLGRSRDRIPLGDEIFRTCPDRPWGPPSLLYNGYRVFPGGKERPGREANTSPPSSALWVVRPVQSLSACTRVTFTFFFFFRYDGGSEDVWQIVTPNGK